MQKIKHILISAGALLSLPLLVHGLDNSSNVDSIEDVQTILERIVNWAQYFFYIIATLFIILAAFSYLTASGDETKIKNAKNKILYALVAIAIAVVAGGVVDLVKGFVK
ncbi:MAG: TrbC/VirB2 family protein [bacterium]|nr:TrbC/VirB2 family protein [bacterium]